MDVKKININQSEYTYNIASEIYDVSAHNNDATFESLQSLLNSDNLSTLIPTAVRCGGMTIRFVQSSDNKYVQYRLMTTSFSTNEADWQDAAIMGTDRIADGAVTTDKIADNAVTPNKLKYWTLPVFNNGLYNYKGQWKFKTFTNNTTAGIAFGLAAIRLKASSANKTCDMYANLWLGDTTGDYPSFILLDADYKIIDTIYLPNELFDGRIIDALTGAPLTTPRGGYFKISVPIAEIMEKYQDAFILVCVISDKTTSNSQPYLVCEQNLGFSVDLAFALKNVPAPYRIDQERITNNAITTEKLTHKVMGSLYSKVIEEPLTVEFTDGAFLLIPKNGEEIIKEYQSWTIAKITPTETEFDYIGIENCDIPLMEKVQLVAYNENDKVIDYLVYDKTARDGVSFGYRLPLGTNYIKTSMRISNKKRFSANGRILTINPHTISTANIADGAVTYNKTNKTFSLGIMKTTIKRQSENWYNNKEFPILIENYYLKNDGESIQENSNYNIVDYLLVPKNVILTFNKLYSTSESSFITYDENLELISAVNVEGSITIDTRDGKDKYIRFSYNKRSSDLSDFSLERAIPEFANGNILYAKKYVACGDSFTHGDFSSESADGNPEEGSAEYESTYDKRMETFKTYPYWIAARNNMKLVNLSKNGDKLVNFAQESNLSQIPEDADYITIKYGINDSHQSVPIGTLSDTDNTTFLGAWNIVLTWLITNRPNAKIGIIASNGCDTEEYSKATVSAAKKYGILYIDEENGENVPYFLRQTFKANNQGIPSAIKTLRTAQYRVSPTNGHPNIEAHKFESTFIEAWMRTL